ncbi:SOS response-associated peptidase [Pseudoxanthomonas kaohsiungensis]|uniref:Abasic site processing protein n=1 Tax=Pseudoxanthomonas kaohsiungensis TaxID=283923 RepID=A0ABW3LZX9_9GAMM|nr:SOS response-associated peptidase [Pseudoxanthomonas kaohsiungensis]
MVQLSLFGNALTPWPAAVQDDLANIEARYNLSPTQRMALLMDDGGTLAVRKMRWGLIPPWAKDLKMSYSTINARVETVAEKPSFRAAWKAGRRCLIPMAGWYEWREQQAGGKKYKQPYYIHPHDNRTLYAAGLWEPRHRLQDEDEAGSVTIITSDAPERFDLHDRTPIFLEADQAAEWMRASAEDAMGMLLAAPFPEVEQRRVSTRVNSSRGNPGGPDFLDPVPPPGDP